LREKKTLAFDGTCGGLEGTAIWLVIEFARCGPLTVRSLYGDWAMTDVARAVMRQPGPGIVKRVIVKGEV